MLGIVALVVLAVVFSVVLRVLANTRGTAATAESALVEQVNRRLPQTQCAQCGYAGCRPYAEAIVMSGEAINRCPPGGEEVVQFLSELLNQPPTSVEGVIDAPNSSAERAPASPASSVTPPVASSPAASSDSPADSSLGSPNSSAGRVTASPASSTKAISNFPPTSPLSGEHAGGVVGVAARAVVDENECIGCALCLPACPVDAIVGAPGRMHTVLPRECTGCELCIAPCPVDCISMQSVAQPTEQTAPQRTEPTFDASVAPRAQQTTKRSGRLTTERTSSPPSNENAVLSDRATPPESVAPRAQQTTKRGGGLMTEQTPSPPSTENAMLSDRAASPERSMLPERAAPLESVTPSSRIASPARATPLPCIHCGACDDACPEQLLAKDLYHSARRHDWRAAERLGVSECIECDRCVSVCPSAIPLTDFYRFAKRELAVREAERREAARLRMRYEAHTRRGSEARKLERAARDAARDAAKEAIKRKLKNDMSRSEERVA